MGPAQTYTNISVSEIHTVAQKEKAKHNRCIQMSCTKTDDGIDVLYSFRSAEGISGITNYVVHGLSDHASIPSIQNIYPAMFPFENEAHDLFGINVCHMNIDFEGSFYRLNTKSPMTIVSPEQIKRKERAKKIAQARAKKAARKKSESISQQKKEE